MYEVIFFKDKNGNAPLEDYIYSLIKKGETSKKERIQATKIVAYIKALQEYGTRIGTPTVKHIEGRLWELRPLENRIFFFFWQENTFVLLHHYIKKSQKAPTKEIEQAKRNLFKFLENTKK